MSVSHRHRRGSNGSTHQGMDQGMDQGKRQRHKPVETECRSGICSSDECFEIGLD